ncbi:MAG: hypothetical protein JWQ61_3280 [Collimonas fungivorans]|nr:hypothetical protein [Collimonas fungivorans]
MGKDGASVRQNCALQHANIQVRCKAGQPELSEEPEDVTLIFR